MNLTHIIWSIVATVLSGSFILIALITPHIGTLVHLSDSLVIVAAALLGAIVAVPISIGVTRSLLGNKKLV